jgi:hypothetical protein
MYKSAWGYWGLINNTASGGNTYTYGEGNNPYKADGSSAQWQTQGANISATAVVKGSNNGGDTGGGTSNADYIVSGAVSVPEVNGEYVEDGTLNDRPKYVNTSNSNAIIRFDSMVGWSVFYMGQPKYTTMDTTSATPPVSATWKYGSETVTVVKGNSSGGGDSSGNTNTGYIVTYFENNPNLEGNYLKANTPSWGDSSYEYYKHQDIDVYLYIAGSNVVFRSFDTGGFTSDYWFSASIKNNIVGNFAFMNENSGTMYNVTVTQG